MLVTILCILAIIALLVWLGYNFPSALEAVIISILVVVAVVCFGYIILDISGITFLGI